MAAPLIQLPPVTPAAGGGAGLQHGDGAQHAVLRSVQLPLRAVGGAAGLRDGAAPPPGAVLPLRPLQGSRRGGAPALRRSRPGEARDARGGMQVRDGPRGKAQLGTPVTGAPAHRRLYMEALPLISIVH